MISVVLPVYNECDNIEPLWKEIEEVMNGNYSDWEAIFVDDGSKDGSRELLAQKSSNNQRFTTVLLKDNFGQSEALQAGIDASQGEVVVTLDSDMQNDPADIPRLVETLEEGSFDAVNGWRRDRSDPLMKKLWSRFAEKLRKATLGTELHDFGCTLKAFTREAADELQLRGEMHRYIPPVLEGRGYEMTEIEVNHRQRHAGETKYSWRRLPKGFLDLLNVWFWQKYDSRPLHIFGGLGILSGVIGSLGGSYAVYLKVFEKVSLSDTALPLFAVLMTMLGVQFFISGILADIAIKNYHQNSPMKSYNEEKTIE